MASLAYLPSSPTLFNSGTRHTQMSSLLPRGHVRVTSWSRSTTRYAQVAALSKFAGGIGISFSRRALPRGS